MIELPTPETDALFYRNGYPVVVDSSKVMQLCEKLEQERDWITEKFKLLEGCFKRAERERDEARDQSQRLRVQLNHYTQANEMAEQAFRERDEAHKIAEQAIEDLAWFNETNAQRLRNKLEKLKESAK